MTYDAIDRLLDAEEEIVEFSIINKESGSCFPHARAYKNNTLGQILEGYSDNIGITHSEKYFFENKRTGKSTSDLNLTVAEFDLCSGDVLFVLDDGTVAGISEEDETMTNEEILEISVTNMVSGSTYPQARVYPNNSLGQILEGYAKDISITCNGRVLFINKRTNKSTSDSNLTVEAFGLCNGDVLGIMDDACVAGLQKKK